MQVTHVDGAVTHAVIGGEKAQDFGISNSAEFFNILSNSLYSDKPLAVVREALCNAWDIHIATGRTDIPVEVTLKDGVFSVKDYGTGISHENMGPTYCTYGNSTKKLDGMQTGGFGLGCKAPFAVVDHFDVESCHEGTKSIYAISKSSAEVAGKPSLTRILDVPTTDTGMKVSLKVPVEMLSAFESLVKMITRFGEMNVVFNGEPLPTLPFSEAKQGFLITDNVQGVSGAPNSSLFVRYGNVVYPIPEHDIYGTQFRKCTELLKLLDPRDRYNRPTGNMRLILQAKPNTIAVTPSRESLSMTDQTIDALTELMTTFLSNSGSRLSNECGRIAEQVVERQWILGRPADLLTDSNNLPNVQRLLPLSPNGNNYDIRHGFGLKPIMNIEDISTVYMRSSYPSLEGFHEADINRRIQALLESGFGNRGKIQSFRKELKTTKLNAKSDWLLRTIVTPLMLAIEKEEKMDPSKFFIYTDNSEPPKRDSKGAIIKDEKGKPKRNSYSWQHGYRMTRVVQPRDMDPKKLEDQLPFLRNFIILSYNRLDIEERAPSMRPMKNWFGTPRDSLVYIVSRAKDRAAQAKEFFEKLGLFVVDLTQLEDWEKPPVREHTPSPVGRVAPKPKKKGLIPLPTFLTNNKTGFVSAKSLPEDVSDAAVRIEKPAAVTKLVSRYSADGYTPIPDIDIATNLLLAHRYGKETGVAVNENQYNKFIEMGSQDYIDYVASKVMLEITTSPTFQAAYSFSWACYEATTLKSRLPWGKAQTIRRLINTPALLKALGLNDPGTDTDREMLKIYKEMSESRSITNRKSVDFKSVDNLIKNTLPHPSLVKLVEKFINSPLIKFIDMEEVMSLFLRTPSNAIDKDGVKKHKALCQGALDLLAFALEG